MTSLNASAAAASGTARSVAIITGGSRGLGRSTVLALAAQGVDAIFTYRQADAAADAVTQAAAALGATALALPLNVSDTGSFPAFADRVRTLLATHWQRQTFDFLVNNAGTTVHKPFTDSTEADFDALTEVHFKGPYFLTQTLLPLLADGGRIINVSSGLARFSYPGSSIYGPLKAAVESWTRYLAKELGPRRITANVIAPGPVATDFGGGLVRDTPEVNKMLAAQTALGRVGDADDIGPLVAALLSPAAGWVNGQRIEASGGINL